MTDKYSLLMLSRRFFTSLFTLVLLGAQGWAQPEAFRPFANESGWEYVSSANFDVYYSGGEKAAASKVARYAELARYELGVLYDYKPTSRYTLVYANDPLAFLSNNLSMADPAVRPGVFNLPRMEAYIFHPGNNQALFQAIKREVSQLILREFSYGEGLGSSIQRQVLFSNPEWFSKGLSEYVAGGWSYTDEMWIANIKTDDLVELALEGDDYANRVVRKSVWRYIAHEYGEQKLSEIIYLVNISHSIESGVISVLGIGLQTLTSRWREYINTRTSTRSASRLALKDITDVDQIGLRAEQELVGFAFNEARNVFAMYLNEQGSQTVELYDPETGKYLSTGIQSGISSREATGLEFHYPMAWSQDGATLVTTLYRERQYYVAYYDLESKTLTTLPLDQSIDRILSLNYSHDGQSIVLSALHDGRTDIFTTRAGEAEFRALTNDPFDNLNPVWSMDDQSIFFASNRDTNVLNLPAARWQSYRNDFNLYKYDRAAKSDTVEQLTFTPTINEQQPFALSSFELGYISDEFGVRNLSKINVFLRESESISNLSSGIDQLQVSEKWVAFSAPVDGRSTLLWAPTRNLQTVRPPEPTLLRLEYLAAYRDRQARQEAMEKREAATLLPDEATPDEAQEEEPQVDEEGDKPRKTKKKDETEKKPIRYYIFDEEDEPYELARPENIVFGVSESNEKAASYVNVFGDLTPPKLAAFVVSEAQEARNVWSADYVGLSLVHDYVPRYGMEFSVGFSDLLKNHRIDAVIRPYFNLKNADAQVRYTYQKNRLDLWAETQYQTRLYRPSNANSSVDTLVFRYEKANLRLGATYPLSAYLAVEGSAAFYSLTQQDLNLRRPERRDDNDQLVSASVALRYDKTQQKQGFYTRGFAADFSVESMYSLGMTDFTFHTARLQLRHYLPVHKQIVLATQLNSSVSVDQNRQQYYMGGVQDWMVGVFFDDAGGPIPSNNDLNDELNRFSFQEFATPVRGFRFNSRRGSKYVLVNSELRIPITRLLKHSLHSGALYNLEWIPFIDAGTVWDQGNPFSQKNPTDTQIIGSPPVTVLLQTLKSPFVFGFGSGLRTNIVGYSLRMDLAWGIDDNTLKQPVLSISMAKNF